VIVIGFLQWLKTLYCGMIFSHDVVGSYEINDVPVQVCGRCGKVWMEGEFGDEGEA
jgi:hypothetical protein